MKMKNTSLAIIGLVASQIVAACASTANQTSGPDIVNDPKLRKRFEPHFKRSVKML